MKFVFFANTDWYLYNFRLPIALALKRMGHEVVMVSPAGEFGSRFKAHGLRWATIAMERASLNPWRELRTLCALVSLLKDERPDLLHGFTIKCAVYGALAARVARVPAVVNAVAGMGYVFTSGDIKARLLRPLLKGLMRWTLASKQSLLILQNPNDVEDFVSGKMVPEQQVRLILGSGVDTVRFCPNDRPMPLGSRLRVLLAARLLWEKGIQEFVDAAILLRAQGRDVEFLLAGMPDAGNPRSVGRAQVQKWADSGLITWLGHVDDMPKLLQSVNVMALPSYYREGVPKSLIEGAASGLALITTDRPGCREVVRKGGVDGLLVEPRNGAQLAELIAQLDDDRVLLQALGKKARQNSLAYFDERQVIRRTMGVYAELLPAFLHG
jgi:glycosyltransferase involved in cell wall biosynthesis